jgi:Caspase domain
MKRALLICASGILEDIQQQYQLLVNRFRYSKHEIIIVEGSMAWSAIKDTVAKSGWYDQLWIYYSGHGMQNGGLICDGKTIEEKHNILLEPLCDQISKIKSREVLLIFDCCYSGKIGKTIAKRCLNPNVSILCSSMDNERSHNVYDTKTKTEKGAFTVSFLECLGKIQDEISIMDLYDLICREFLDMGIPNQSPILVRSSSKANIHLIANGKAPNLFTIIRHGFTQNMGYR